MNDKGSEKEQIFPERLLELSEEDLYLAIKERVTYLLETKPEILMSYLYRLDVLEAKIKAVLLPESPVPPIEGLSRLILERQLQRIESKKKYKSPQPIPGWEY